MKIRLYLYLIVVAGPIFTGCGTVRQQAYYVSPFNSHSSDYHPLPQTTDSARSAVYIQGAWMNGGANQERTDGVKAFRTSVSVAHHTDIFQAYYGGDLTLGAYHLGTWDSGYAGFFGPRSAPPDNAKFLNAQSGHKFFGGVGLNGGFNLVLPMRRSEWRYIGLETSLQKEFGDYLSFRKKLPDTAAALIIRNSFFATLGFTTEIIRRTEDGEWGLRFASGWALGRSYQNPAVYDNESRRQLHYGYVSFSFHYTLERYTGYLQFTNAEQARSLHVGLHYRLSRPKIAARYPRQWPKRDPFRN